MCLPFLFHFTKQMYILLIGLNDIWMREIDCAHTQIQKMSSYWVSDLFKYAWEQNMAHNCKFLILWLCFIESHTSRGKNIVENRLLIRLRGEAWIDQMGERCTSHWYPTFHLGCKTTVYQLLQLKSRRDFSCLVLSAVFPIVMSQWHEFWYLICTEKLPGFAAC